MTVSEHSPGWCRVIRKVAVFLAVAVGLAFAPAVAHADNGGPGGTFTPGAAGVGDPYFPSDGNGGYDVSHYDLDVRYQPGVNLLTGRGVIKARATQNLSQFNLDLKGLTVRSVKVNGGRANWTRPAGTDELVITPARGLRDGRRFTVEIRYDGNPQPNNGPGSDGFIPTDDGALVIGEPHVASSWFPVNDHPSDKASYDVRMTVPAGLEAVSNGVLVDSQTRNGWTSWKWRAKEPMASYLATATVGEFDLNSYRSKGISFVDAVDPDLFDPVATPTTGSNLLISQTDDSSYKRLTRTISVPAEGAQLSYWVTRDTEQPWDFTFVEARTAGLDDWTTLPDVNGHTNADLGFSCPGWLQIHPFLAHYQTDNGDFTCSASGTSGSWNAATGKSQGPEQWTVDLSSYSGKNVEVSISYASDEVVQHNGVFVDDIVVSTGEGSTSFEADGDEFDGWVVAGAPVGSPGNAKDWIIGTVANLPRPVGEVVNASLAREPEIVDFLSQQFGRYPFSASGGIVDDVQGLGFALENQTRPIYAVDFFTDEASGASVIAHELAHQWFGDSLAVHRWQHIWLNEGFATYAEWLWSEHEGGPVPQDFADFYNTVIPADDPFWALTIGDPGPDRLFDGAVYVRGALTLQQLRLAIGDEKFFQLLRTWARSNRGGNVTTPQFIALAERISGQELDSLFNAWLFTGTKPDIPAAPTASTLSARSGSAGPAAAALMKRLAAHR